MIRATTEQNKRKCKKCDSKPATHGPRCHECHTAWKNAAARQRRQKIKESEMQENENLIKTGWQRCTQCKRKLRLSEFDTSLPGRKGKLNKICDRCLTHIYACPARSASKEISHEYWRKRAYSLNSVGRQRLARERHVPIFEVTLSDLHTIAKPQHLAEIYAKSQVCCYCGVDLTSDNIAVDHIVPLSRGGKHSKTNWQLICKDCNHLKATRTHSEFIAFLAQYITRLSVVEASGKLACGNKN